MRIDDDTYEFVRASDLVRDGMSLECRRVGNGLEPKLVMEAFWHDPTGRFTVWCCGEELPFSLVQAFMRKAAEGCPPMKTDEPGTKVLIYVALLDEGVAVWRPVAAEFHAQGLYRITDVQPEDERWQFTTGNTVRCEEHRFQDGTVGLVARERAG